MRQPPPTHAQRGFSFLEVLIAMSILIVGSVSILSLFVIGVHNQVERRIEKRLEEVRPEVMTIVQEAVDTLASDAKLTENTVKGRPLSKRGYTVDVRWTPNPFGGPGWFAHAVILFRDEPVATLKPIPVTRSTLNPNKPK